MTQLQIYDPEPARHEFVSRMYYAPMLEYARGHGIDLTRIDTLVPSAGKGVICDADWLTPEKIIWFKENRCQLFAFNCIDSAYLSETIRYAPEMLLINRIFMLAGIMNRNFSTKTAVTDGPRMAGERVKYLPDDAWERFDFMRARGGLQALPYPIWNRVAIPERRPFEERRPTVLFRGGAHFLRVMAFLMALKNGCADEASGFLLADYFKDTMNPQFRFCEECRALHKAHGGNYPATASRTRGECASPAEWGGEEVNIQNTGLWNNKCPKSWLWLADKLGVKDMEGLGRALNFKGEEETAHRETIAQCRFFADAKWEFSIYSAQRFWEAASVGTVNLLPRRANDQDHFPAMQDGEHYLTFTDEMEEINAGIDKERFERISGNAYALWEKWIRPTDYAISTNLLKHIFDTIFTPRDT